MAGIDRQKALIFANDAEVRLVTAFRTTEDETPTKTKQPNVIQNANFLQGWINNDNTGNVEPYAEDMNAVFYTLSYNTAYLYEKGIPEYSADQTYQQNSFCQYGGVIYRCKTDSTINVLPTNTTYWDKMETAAYSASNIGTTGAGVYASMTGNNFNFKKIKSSDSSVTITEGADYIDLKSYTGGGTAAFTANSPLTYSSGVLSISKADGSTNGYLSSADWTSFNSKLSSTIFSANNTWTGTNTFNSVATTSFTLNGSTLATVAVTGDYEDLLNTPTIPTVNNATLTIQKNGTTVDTFTANSSTDTTVNITVPTDTGDLTNGAGFIDSSIFSSNNTWTGSNNVRNITTTGDITYSIGDGDNRFKEVYSRIYRLSKKAHMYTNSTDGYDVRFEWWNDTDSVSRTLICGGNNIYSTSNKIISLGNTSSYWDTVYSTSITFSESSYLSYNYSAGSDELLLNWKTGIVNFKIKTDQGSIHSLTDGDIALGSPSRRWYNVYSKKFSIDDNTYIEITNAVANLGLNWKWNSTEYGLHCYHDMVLPKSSNSTDLGSTSLRWRNTYTTKIYLGASEASISNNRENNDLTFSWKYVNNTRQISMYHDYFMPEATNTINLGGSNNRWATVYYTTLNPSSDIRLKDNIEPLENGLAKINSLDVKSFTFKNKLDHIEYGIIAQDTVSENPELISVPEDESGYYGIYLHNFVFLAVKAIQELSAKVSVLENKLGELK